MLWARWMNQSFFDPLLHSLLHFTTHNLLLSSLGVPIFFRICSRCVRQHTSILYRPCAATSRHPHISAPRQPSLPRLHVKVPDISPCFSEPSHPTHTSQHHSQLPFPPYSHTRSPPYSRRTSWSPSQAIPEGHYSKGFTLTNLHRAEKSSSSSTSTSYTHYTLTPLSTGATTSSASPGVRRSQTVHKPESTSPFKRLVGRSKSMKVKTMTPFVVSALETETTILGNGNGFAPFDKSPINTQPRFDNKDNQSKTTKHNIVRVVPMEEKPLVATKPSNLKDIKVSNEKENETSKVNNNIKQDSNHARAPSSTVNLSKPLPSPPISGSKPRPTIVSSMVSHSIVSKPLWQHTMTNAEEISTLGLNSQDVQKQETIFELIYTEGEYLEDLKGIYRVTFYGGYVSLFLCLFICFWVILSTVFTKVQTLGHSRHLYVVSTNKHRYLSRI